MDITYRQCTIEEFEAVFPDDHPTEALWCDFAAAKKASHIYGAEVNGKIRGAIAFGDKIYEPIDADDQQTTLSYIVFQYVSRSYRNKGIGTALLTCAIKLLIAAHRTPIGCGVTSSRMMSIYNKLPPDLKQSVVLFPTNLDDGLDIWEERNL